MGQYQYLDVNHSELVRTVRSDWIELIDGDWRVEPTLRGNDLLRLPTGSLNETTDNVGSNTEASECDVEIGD